jgi:hypothetical protein
MSVTASEIVDQVLYVLFGGGAKTLWQLDSCFLPAELLASYSGRCPTPKKECACSTTGQRDTTKRDLPAYTSLLDI